MNLKPKQKEGSPIQEGVLSTYLNQINESGPNRDTLLVDQFHVLQNLCHRKAFTLTDRQIAFIHKKF